MADPLRREEPGKAPERPRNLIGKPFRRVDGRSKVTGSTRYADDLSFPRMVYMKLVRSTVPHAKIGKIDLTRWYVDLLSDERSYQRAPAPQYVKSHKS